jgi:hypothetical protein
MSQNGSGPTSTAVVEDEARKSDQLASEITSDNNASANANQAQLIKTIKAHIAKGDKAREKADQHYIAAGKYLKELKGDLSQAEFLEIVREKIGIGKSRTYELLAIADGTKTLADVAASTTKRSQKRRARLSVAQRTNDNADDPEASAEAMKAKHAAADAEGKDEDEGDSFLDDNGDFARSIPPPMPHVALAASSIARSNPPSRQKQTI